MRKLSILFLVVTVLIGCMPKVEISKSIDYLRLTEVKVKTLENPIYDTIKIKSIQGVELHLHKGFYL